MVKLRAWRWRGVGGSVFVVCMKHATQPAASVIYFSILVIYIQGVSLYYWWKPALVETGPKGPVKLPSSERGIEVASAGALLAK